MVFFSLATNTTFKTIRYLLLTCSILCIGSASVKAQALEIDLSHGFHANTNKFYHSSSVETIYQSSTAGYNYYLGLTHSFNKHFSLRTEIGYTSTKTLFTIAYDYTEGSIDQREFFSSYLYNQKIHLGILPELRASKGLVTAYLNGGILYTTDVYSHLASVNEDRVHTTDPIALACNGGVIIAGSRIGAKLNIGYTRYGETEILGIFKPTVSFRHINFGFGVVYKIGKS